MKIKINDNQYIMPKTAIDSIISKFEKIEKKRVKLIEKGRLPVDFPEIKVEFKNINSDLEKELLDRKDLSVTKKKLLQHGIKERNLYEVSINTNSLPVLENWRVLGSINKNPETDTYTMDSYSPKKHPIPLQYRDTDPCNCDHCGHNRKRNSTFIIENQEDDKLLQVGSACMTDFVSKETMDMLLLFSNSINILRNFDPDIGSGNNSKSHYMLDKLEFLATVNAAMEASNGFVAKKKANYYANIIPTFSAAMHKMEPYYLETHLNNLYRFDDTSEKSVQNYRDFIEALSPTQKDYDKVQEVIEWYRSNPPKDSDDESYFNTHSILTNESAMLFNNEAGTVCYAIQKINNIQNNAERKLLHEQKESQKLPIPIFFGNDGDKLKNIELKLTNVSDGENMFGYYINYYFKSRDGRDFNWQASGGGSPDALNAIEGVDSTEDLIAYVAKARQNNEEIWLQMKGTIRHNSYVNNKGVNIKNNKLSYCNSVSEIYDKPMTSGTPNFNSKYLMNEFKVADIKEGLAYETGESQFLYTLVDSDDKEFTYMPYKKIPNIQIGEHFQTPMQFARTEVIGLDQSKILKIEEFTEDFNKALITENKMLKFNTKPKTKQKRK
jgi:hypothetical protein